MTSFRDNSPPAYSNAANALYNAVANADLRSIDSMMTQDATLIYTWNDLTVAGSVYNLADEDPPQVYAAQEFDPYTHNPLGRMWKLQLTYSLGAPK